jgi:hypothetical protein
MKAADFILIQVNQDDRFYELARVRPYTAEAESKDAAFWAKKQGFYCEGIAQNNGNIYEFSLHLGNSDLEIKHKFINLGQGERFIGGKVCVNSIKQVPLDFESEFADFMEKELKQK